ncbi:hypothetical protein F5876DRAFT_69153 [Lentinula aff. lateritia]|uniref:Uncharacterized protein n=1 Tax=Lentinula aff. lateritia TaxID=2804960 RepID=A0ACC1TNZ5_9AGAR|nr:hypothetical protein F5876DRAFT_69153 [Lentinula aff. lateritia]
MPIVTRSRSKSIQQELTAVVAPAMALPALSPIPALPLSASASTHSYGISGCSTLTSLSQLSAALHRYSPESGHSAWALGVVAQARANIGEHSAATPMMMLLPNTGALLVPYYKMNIAFFKGFLDELAALLSFRVGVGLLSLSTSFQKMRA